MGQVWRKTALKVSRLRKIRDAFLTDEHSAFQSVDADEDGFHEPVGSTWPFEAMEQEVAEGS